MHVCNYLITFLVDKSFFGRAGDENFYYIIHRVCVTNILMIQCCDLQDKAKMLCMVTVKSTSR